MDGDYPKEISDGFTGIPNDIDTAMVWSGNGKIYFYKGSKFWRFDPSQRPPVKSTYPKPISNWEGVPDNLDAAFQWTNGYTYFYKDGAYYRYVFAVRKIAGFKLLLFVGLMTELLRSIKLIQPSRDQQRTGGLDVRMLQLAQLELVSLEDGYKMKRAVMCRCRIRMDLIWMQVGW